MQNHFFPLHPSILPVFIMILIILVLIEFFSSVTEGARFEQLRLFAISIQIISEHMR